MKLVIYGQRRPLGGKLRMPEKATLFGEERMPGFVALVGWPISKCSVIAENLENSVHCTDDFVSRIVNKNLVELDIRSGSLRVPVDAQRVPTRKATPSRRHIKDMLTAEDQVEFENS